MQQTPDVPLQSLIGLSVHLALGHLVAALVAVWIGTPLPLALIAGIAAGLVVTAALQRTVWLVAGALDRLGRGLAAAALPTRWHFLLSALVARLNGVIERVNSITALRDGLVRQTGEAAAQQERNRLARDLHDSIKQQVFSISMSAAAVEARWQADTPGARQALADVRQSAKEALVEMTALLQQLSPAPLEKVGLEQAIRDQCEALGYRSGAQVVATFGDLPPDDRLPPGTPDSLFRIVQEALSNVARHARATQVEVSLEQRGETLTLEVRDDGQGYQPGAARQGMGLTNIQQRVAALGGRLAVESRPGQGTRLAVEIPLVEILFAQEEVMVIKAEHTLNRTFLAGAIGGLALIAALFYPLYVDWPGRFTDDWPTRGIPGLSLGLSALAALLVVATGYVAARWARVGRRAAGTLFGALAGWIAALAAYVVLGAPAAGVGASEALLRWGYRPALDDPHALWLTAEPVINAIYWTYAALWVMQIGGLALGALGGTFAPASAEIVPQPELRSAAATIAGLVAFVYGESLLVAPAIFNLLEGTLTGGRGSSTGVPMAEAVAPRVFTLPPEGVAIIPTGTALILFALALAVLYLVRAGQRRAGDPVELRGSAALSFLYALLPAGIGVWIGLMNLTGTTPMAQPSGVLAVATIVVCVGFAGLFVAQAIADLRRREPGEPIFGEWNPLIFIMLVMSLSPLMGYSLDRLASLVSVWGLLAIGLLLLWAFYWFKIRPQGIGLTAWLANRIQNPRIRKPHQFNRLWQGTLNVLSAGLPVALLIMSQVVSAALAMVLIVVPGIVVIYAYGQDPLPPEALRMMETGPAEMIRQLYFAHARSLAMALIGTFVVIGLVLLMMRGWEALMARVVRRSEAASDQAATGQ